MQQTGWNNKGERAEMGLHPSIRSLLAANAGFTTGNVTSLPKWTLSLSTPSSHLPSPLELNSSGAHFGAKQITPPPFFFLLDEEFCFVLFFFPIFFWNPAPPASPQPRRANPGTLPPWLAEQVAARHLRCLPGRSAPRCGGWCAGPY